MALHLRIQNFRSHADHSIDIDQGISIITGPNGSGKTSLMEAIYVAHVGKSWRSNFDEICRRDGDQLQSEWWRVDLTDDATGDSRTVKYQRRQKSFIIDDREYRRLPRSAKWPVILFEPNDMQLLYGSPTRRRQFLDRFIAQVEPTHQTELSKFDRVLKQRNNLLKQEFWPKDEMAIWDIQFASLSSSISQRRRQYLKLINNVLQAKYCEIAGNTTGVSVRFMAGAPADPAGIIQRLANSTDRVTPIGAQKDDYKFIFNHGDAKVSASRGENRTIIFAVLGALIDLARDKYGDHVITLLDDIDSELDQTHRTNLYAMSSFQQRTIATTLEYCGGDSCHHIQL